MTRAGTFTDIKATKAAFNYADFQIVLTGPPKATEDGGVMVLATVEDIDGTTLVSSPRRMVCVPGTTAATMIGKAKKGQRFRVLGIPRVNLERVMALSTGTSVPAVIRGAYEMIVVAVE